MISSWPPSTGITGDPLENPVQLKIESHLHFIIKITNLKGTLGYQTKLFKLIVKSIL